MHRVAAPNDYDRLLWKWNTLDIRVFQPETNWHTGTNAINHIFAVPQLPLSEVLGDFSTGQI